MSRPLKALIIEDSIDDTLLMVLALEDAGYTVTSERVESMDELQACLKQTDWDVVLSDYSLPRLSALKGIAAIRSQYLDLPVIVVSGTIGEEAAVAIMKAGANDYLMKSNLRGLAAAIERHMVTAAANRRLREVEERFRLLLDNVKDVSIFQMDQQGTILSWSGGARRMFGYSAEEVIGQPLSIIFSDADRLHDAAGADIRQAREHGKSEATRLHKRKDGTLFYSEGSLTALKSADGVLQGFAHIARDITEKKRAEEEKEHLYQIAQQSNRMKDEFLATLSHELRTPLGVILGHLQLLKYEEILAPTVAESLEAIERNAKSQQHLIEDLLDVSRIITGKVVLQWDTLDFARLVRTLVETHRFAAEAKGVELHIAIDEDIGPVRGDESRLQQILWNLLSNAIKFTAKSGRIEVRLRKLATRLELSVQDTGIGIDPSFLPYVFDRFRQADSSMSRVYSGLGLGLAIVKHIAELHGAVVRVESPGIGQGSCFSVSFPRPVTAATADEPPRDQESHGLGDLPTSLRILLVDDHADTRNVLSKALERYQFLVIPAESARQALALAQSQPFDLIISDIGMPSEDGLAFIEQLRQLGPPAADTPAIAVTAHAREEDKQRAAAAGFAAHLAKPIAIEGLLRTIQSLFPPA